MKLFPHNSESGFSLIEVLIALVILVIVILGGSLYFFYGRLGINREGYRRAALELASQRLEKLKPAKYSEIIPDDFGPDYGPYYIYGSWEKNTEETEDTVAVGNPSGEENGMMVTKAEPQEVQDDDSYGFLKVTVTVKWDIAQWDDNTTNKVELVTLIAP